MANMMNIKKRTFAIPTAAAKTPVNPTMAAIIAMTRKINAQANIEFSSTQGLELRLVDEFSSRK